MRISSPGRWLNRKGFTLFELMVAIAIVGLVVGVVATQSNNWFDLNIKKATNRISNTVRYLRDKASTENLYIRLVFDFEKNNYWVEATTERFLLTSKEVLEAEEKEKEEEAKEAETEVKTETVTKENEEGEEEEVDAEVSYVQKYRTPEFGAVDDFLLKPVSLPDGVFLKDIYTGRSEGPITGGQAFIYFFPNGYIEPAIINLMDEDDEVNFSIKIDPIIGATDLLGEYRAMEQQE